MQNARDLGVGITGYSEAIFGSALHEGQCFDPTAILLDPYAKTAVAGDRTAYGGGVHSSTFRLGMSTFRGIRQSFCGIRVHSLNHSRANPRTWKQVCFGRVLTLKPPKIEQNRPKS
jgi:hypothetical protein